MGQTNARTTASRRLRKILGRVALGVLAAGLLLQLFPGRRSNPPVEHDVQAPPQIESILRRACYDCHSHETAWPWYSRFAPISWWLVDHVDHARGDLNFSDWPVLDFEARSLALRDIEKQVASGEMPLWSYKLLHPDARLSDADREAIVDWARTAR